MSAACVGARPLYVYNMDQIVADHLRVSPPLGRQRDVDSQSLVEGSFRMLMNSPFMQ